MCPENVLSKTKECYLFPTYYFFLIKFIYCLLPTQDAAPKPLLISRLPPRCVLMVLRALFFLSAPH